MRNPTWRHSSKDKPSIGITDHNQILPLYDYGIGTYDFDMEKVKPMIDLAQDKAQEETLKFFNPTE